jgi:ferritin-like metal-binding protein YciE
MTQEHPHITTLQQLFDDDICKFSAAEVALKTALGKWIVMASSLQLKSVLQKYELQVETHIHDFEPVFDKEGLLSLNCTHPAMQALISELEEKLLRCSDTPIRDACLLAGVQLINHFKISIYGTAAAFARELNMEEQAAIFHKAEVSEKQVDDRLNQLAAFEINPKASAPVFLTS